MGVDGCCDGESVVDVGRNGGGVKVWVIFVCVAGGGGGAIAGERAGKALCMVPIKSSVLVAWHYVTMEGLLSLL